MLLSETNNIDKIKAAYAFTAKWDEPYYGTLNDVLDDATTQIVNFFDYMVKLETK